KDAWRNRAITDPFEPGSTFKVILAAAALEEGVVRPDDQIYAENGAITLAKTTIRDWKKYGWLTFSEVLQYSSNVGSIKVGLQPLAVRQVVSPATARTLTRILVKAVEAGTGHNAAIPGYEVAGKTGTAQKLDPTTGRYSRAPGVLSFVGWAPADEPRFVMLVMLDEPKNEQWGSEAAAPVFGAIGREILRYFEVAPRDVQPVQIVTGPADTRPDGAAVK